MNGNIKVLDCTLRDGGLGLEDFSKNDIITETFTRSNRIEIANCVSSSGIDIVELGTVEESETDLEKFAIYQSMKSLSQYIPEKGKEDQLYVCMFRGPDIDLDRIPEHSDDLCDGIRVILRYSELRKSLDYSAALVRKGYKVFLQPMLTMRYSDDELRMLIEAANEMKAYALYFVDSYGYMNEKDVERLFQFYNSQLDPDINIGFHAHNNMNLAFANARFFIEHRVDRNIIVDSCAMGMGQGAGNLQTEIIVNYLNSNLGKEYKFEKILEICEILEKFCPNEMETWGYSPVRLISAIHRAAYKYAVAMRVKYNMSLVEINRLLSNMPDNMRHRYTLEDLLKLLGSKDQENHK